MTDAVSPMTAAGLLLKSNVKAGLVAGVGTGAYAYSKKKNSVRAVESAVGTGVRRGATMTVSSTVGDIVATIPLSRKFTSPGQVLATKTAVDGISYGLARQLTSARPTLKGFIMEAVLGAAYSGTATAMTQNQVLNSITPAGDPFIILMGDGTGTSATPGAPNPPN